MASQPYLVVRLIPEAPIDGATFATYLDNLQLQVFDAYTGAPVSDLAYSSPLTLFAPLFLVDSAPGTVSSYFLTAVSAPTTQPASYVSAGDYGQTLKFESTSGISAGSFVFSSDQTTIPPSGLSVTQVTETTVTLNSNLPNYVPTATVVSFISNWPNTTPFGAGSPPQFSLNTTAPAQTLDGGPPSTQDPPSVLLFANTQGVTPGMSVGPAGPDIAANTTAAEVTPTSVIISPPLLGTATPSPVTFSLSEPYASLTLKVKTSTTTTLTFPSAAGVAVGMTLSPQSGIPPGIVVIGATATTVTLKPALPAALAASTDVTFTFPLSSGIVQHVSEDLKISFSGISIVLTPMAVATAIIPLNFSTPNASNGFPLIPDYLNVTVEASRLASTGEMQDIPIKNTFYNVLWQGDDSLLGDSYLYQLIPDSETSFYITLPPPPGLSPVALDIPSDGSAPPFDPLYQAIATALSFDPIPVLTPVTSPGVTLKTNAGTSSGSTLSFASATGVAVGMYAFGTNVAPGTLVSSVSGGNVVLNGPVLTGGVGMGEPVTFAPALGAVAAKTSAGTTSGSGPSSATLTFASTAGIVPGMFVSGAGVQPGSTVTSVSGPNVMLSTSVIGTGVGSGETVFFTPAASLIASLCSSTANCTRIAYDIVWSFQSPLPNPPDPLESLYTDPPNPGNSSTTQNSSNQVLEQDRQKFEGTLNSFYATRNATAERLAKFVAAASAGVYCELSSENATAALLEFPVDPSLSQPLASAVESEILLQGLGGTSAGSINFGVPAAFFYALGAKMDKSTTAVQRYQIATGDAIDRLLQEFDAAEDQGVIEDSEAPALGGAAISSFQAARRLVALGVSAASGSPAVTLNPAAAAGTPEAALIALVNAWLAATDPTGSGPPPNPPPSYEQKDYTIWQQLLAANQAGYLAIDLYALTQGFAIPQLVAYTSGDTPSGAELTFAQSSLTAATAADCPSGATLTFASAAAASGVTPGMSVGGAKIVPGTQVQTVAATKVTLTAAVTGDVPGGTIISFASSGGAGIGVGMPVSGPNIPAGTIVQKVTATSGASGVTTTVTLSAAVSGDVPANSAITFNAAASSTLADQIDLWLPSTTSPPTSHPTIQTLAAVSASQWTQLFTANPTWLPPFTLPVTPAASQPPSATKTGYVSARIRAFIRAVHKFFTVSSVATSAQPWTPDAPPTFNVPANDPIYGSGLNLNPSSTLTKAQIESEVSSGAGLVFTGGAELAWLEKTLTSVAELTEIAKAISAPSGYALPSAPTGSVSSLAFSVAEALFARGFRSAADIARLSAVDFQQALTGTIAYDDAAALYPAAQAIATLTPPTSAGGNQSFQPINPDGQLTNCIPPPCLAPDGPAAYLAELLKLSERSSCDDPFPAPPSSRSDSEKEAMRVHAEVLWEQAGRPTDHALDFWLHAESSLQSQGAISVYPPPTLGSVLAGRRGPLGNLLATCANVETRLPLVDIVNECLEYMGAATTNTTGAVYATADDQLAGFRLRQKRECEPELEAFEPEALFAAMPEYSTPATPSAANQAVEPAVFDNLKADFSACNLPYSQALDVSRSYLRLLGASRFDALRHFRKCITEFALDANNPPTGFQSHLWRFPARIDTAIEYLGITPEEYASMFRGTAAQPCADRQVYNAQPAAPAGAALFGATATRVGGWTDEASTLSEFLRLTCLTYCEFLELYEAVSTPVGRGNDAVASPFPKCEPCCLKDYRLPIAEGAAGETELVELAIFIRLWRKLHQHCGARYSFAELRDICDVLKFYSNNALNPEFVRQLAAFQMLRDGFGLPLSDPSNQTPGATGADRTQLLSLWIGASAKGWNWALARLLEGVHRYAERQFGGAPRAHEERLAPRLDALSRLAGFNPGSADTWNSSPACTLRFAEVLAKILASGVEPGGLLYVFNAEPADEAERWFASLGPDEAEAYPLDLPAEDERHSLWALRRELLAIELGEEEVHGWTWPRAIEELRAHFGYAPPAGQEPLLSLGKHFFPGALEAAGFTVTAAQRQYRVTLTSSANWNTPAGPLQYDSAAAQLWLELPLNDEAVAAQLARMPELNPAEQAAVSDLYFAPRADLGQLAFLLPDWQSAERELIQEPDEHKRWRCFRRHLALAVARRKRIAAHLARHAAAHAGCRDEDLYEVAALVLSRLLADENTGAPWESDGGAPPTAMWTPPAGGAVAALLALTGTGLQGDYEIPAAPTKNPRNDAAPANPGAGATPPGNASPTQGQAWELLWRDVRGPLEAFGHERDATNSPVPTVVPPLGLSLAGPPASVQNGYAALPDGRRLGGASAFRVSWSGMLLIDHEGDYAFHAGAPAPEGEPPDAERAESAQWRVTLQRGKPTLVLNHQWPGETGQPRGAPRLRRGAYRITVEYAQSAPDFTGAHPRPQRTGFQLKYAGPDSDGRLVTLPLSHLYRDWQDATLDCGLTFLPGSTKAQAFLKGYYTGTLRDIRRTYQGAFKAVLFCAGLELSARREDGQSELGFMLSNPTGFAGRGYYRTGPSSFATHLADFDFDFLPITDDFHPPNTPAPSRSAPSLQRTQAMFDWWERLFDYGQVRKAAARHGKHHIWLLLREALANVPGDAAPLLALIGADPALAPLELRFYQDQTSPIYTVSSADLTGDCWLTRVWRAQAWLDALKHHFPAREIAKARPDLWVANDPAAAVTLSGVTQTGNANLTTLVNAVCLAEGEPRRLRDLKQANDGLRARGRAALLAYLCAQNRVALPFEPGAHATKPEDIADLLLLDVHAGLCETASRIEEAISAVQSFVRRARLTLEPGWKVGREFVKLWDSHFASFHVWQKAKRRELYAENWIEWAEIGAARRIEAFRFLESELRGATLSVAAPGGADWWVDDDTPLEFAPNLLQRRVPSELQPLTPPPDSLTREGLGTLGSPEQAGAPSWLAVVPAAAAGASAPPAAGGSPASPPAAPNASTGRSSNAASTTASGGAGRAAASVAAAAGVAPSLPLWMTAAAELGTAFLRIAAAAPPPAALPFAPRPGAGAGGCCEDCRDDRRWLIDEYYFWLLPAETFVYDDQTDLQSGDDGFTPSHQFGFQDSYYDQIQQQSAEWDDADQVPQLLAKWKPQPAVRLAWCRVHDGQFGQPRKSDLVVQVEEAPSASDLVFLGRVGDSLHFAVSKPGPTPEGYTDSSAPGFRYDLVTDSAVTLPEVLPAPPVSVVNAIGQPASYPQGLPAYPFYAYYDAGAPLFPRDWFAPAMVVADALRVRCDYELALRWYGRAFDPLHADCTWMDCTTAETDSGGGVTTSPVGTQGGGQTNTGTTGTVVLAQGTGQTNTGAPTGTVALAQGGGANAPAAEAKTAASGPTPLAAAVAPPTQPTVTRQPSAPSGGACCDSAHVTAAVARQRALTLRFCETLLEWGEAIMRRRPAPEGMQQARLLFATAARITGRRPSNVLLQPSGTPQPVSSFTPTYAALNPRLLDLYSRVEDRLELLNHCLDARRLRNSEYDPAWFGDNPLREGWRTVATCADEREWCHHPSPYRFTFLIQKATELAGRARELGGALLAAYEKGDAEFLASLRASQERELLALGLSIRQDQWRDADWQVQALQQTKDVSQTNLIYYTGLYQNGLLNDEIQNIDLATNAMQMRTAANITEAVGEAMKVIPDIFLGFCSTDTQVPVGTKLAGVFETIAKVMITIADVQAETAAIDLTEAGWQRRSVEWFHQMQVLPIEIQQVELQILGAQRRRDQAMQELDNQQRQIENATEIEDFLRDKFTATEQYLWLQKETAALYRQMYELAHRTALQAQHAFNLERGHTTRRFLAEWAWDDLHAGLLAGERLESALHHMEMAYANENLREYELTKHISLRLQFPMAFLRLRATGRCEIEIPEWMFDADYPGQFMRRIRSVMVTIPCVTGLYTGVHCRLTLLSSVTRIDPRLAAPARGCCCATTPCACEGDEAARYRLSPDDPRAVKMFGAREAIATSSGQNDSGLFELSFSDPRYLPFEFMGSISRWRLELPPDNNYFDPNTLTDAVLHLNYTAREGGEVLKRAASAAAARKLPGDGWSFFDIRHDFPDAWELFRRPVAHEGGRRDLTLQLRRKFFAYLPHNPPLRVTRLMLLFESADLRERPPEPPCCCMEKEAFGAHVVTFCAEAAGMGVSRHDGSAASLVCRAAAEWPRLYSGMTDIEILPFNRDRESCELRFGFPETTGEIFQAYLFCRYEPGSACAPAPQRDHDKTYERSPHRRRPASDRVELGSQSGSYSEA
jgi:hypothetical protein